MGATPVFVTTPVVTSVNANTANTLRDGTGTTFTAFLAGASGSRIERVLVVARGTIAAATMVRLFIWPGTGLGYLLEEIPLPAVTPSTTVAVASAESLVITPAKPLYLPTGYALLATIHSADSVNVISVGANI